MILIFGIGEGGMYIVSFIPAFIPDVVVVHATPNTKFSATVFCFYVINRLGIGGCKGHG